MCVLLFSLCCCWWSMGDVVCAYVLAVPTIVLVRLANLLHSPLLINIYKREVKGKELPKVVADRIATASNRNLRKALLMLESCYVRQGPLVDSCEPIMAGNLLAKALDV